jgi:hypothetical protein
MVDSDGGATIELSVNFPRKDSRAFSLRATSISSSQQVRLIATYTAKKELAYTKEVMTRRGGLCSQENNNRNNSELTVGQKERCS